MPGRAAVVGAACLAAVALVAVLQILHLGDLTDLSHAYTAGYAKGLLAAYTLAAIATVAAAAALPARLLWVPVAVAAAGTSLVLAVTLVFGGELWSLLWALLTMTACWRVGRWLLDAAGTAALARPAVVPWLAGVGVLGTVLLLIGRAGLLSWWTAGAPVLVLGALGAVGLVRSVGADGARAAWSAVTSARLAAASAALCLLMAGLAAVWTAAPELAFDALYYKAWLPSEWARTGEIGSLTDHPLIAVYGFAEVTAIPGHIAGAEGVGRYLQWLAQGSLVATVWWAGRRSPWAPLGAAALALAPLLFWQETTAYDDAILALGGLALAVAVLSAARDTEGPPLATGIVLVGALAGVCVDLKLHLAPLAAGLLLGWMLFGRGARWKPALAAAVAGLAAIAPLLVMRWIDLDNPLMPAFNNVFQSPYWLAHNVNLGRSGYHPGSLGPVSTLWATLQDADGPFGPTGAFGVLSLAVAVALLTGWGGGRDRAGVPALWVGLLVGATGWYLLFKQARYMLPSGAVAVLVVVLCTGTRVPGRGLQLAGLAGLGATAVLLWPSTLAQFWYVPGRDIPWRAAIGRTDSLQYEQQATPDRDMLTAFDEISPPGAMAAADAHERLWLTQGRDLSPLWEVYGKLVIDGSPPKSPRETLAAVRAQGISWVLASTSIRGGQLAELPSLRRMVEAFGKPVWTSPGGTLYRLPDPDGAPAG